MPRRAKIYQTAIIGRGLIGSAAARHLARLGEKVVLIGPAEPEDKSRHNGVFSSHYDSGRITRILDPHPFYAAIAKKSIHRYRKLERQSGVSFYSEVGHLAVSDRLNYLLTLKRRGDENAVSVDSLDKKMLHQRFSFFDFSAFGDKFKALYQSQDSGHINPRRQIQAQCIALLQDGGAVIEEEARTLTDNNTNIEITTANRRVCAEKILLATGAYANVGNLIPRKIRYDIAQHTIVTGEISAKQARQFSAMPTLICKIGDDTRRYFYFIPPICYPDRRWKVKIGHTDDKTMPAKRKCLTRWFQGSGDPEKITLLKSYLRALLPAVSFRRLQSDSCVTTKSPTDFPYIDCFDNGRVFGVLADNGQCAKSADELGLMAARMVCGARRVKKLAMGYET